MKIPKKKKEVSLRDKFFNTLARYEKALGVPDEDVLVHEEHTAGYTLYCEEVLKGKMTEAEFFHCLIFRARGLTPQNKVWKWKQARKYAPRPSWWSGMEED